MKRRQCCRNCQLWKKKGNGMGVCTWMKTIEAFPDWMSFETPFTRGKSGAYCNTYKEKQVERRSTSI